MAIYRGAGGAGDATGDSASEALLVRELAAEVAADAAAAEAARASAVAAKNAAETAETNAETAETNAETAETNAETAQAAAASSASAASSSASAASTSASNASTSATAAAGSASTAGTQATNAASSASAASTSASNASSSASAASTSATNASNSATAASGSASTASTQATNAASSASAASTSATNASNSATSASTSATTATTQAGIATTQAGNASTSATAASTSATNASNSASAASTSATNASNSASAASTSASNASTSASNASTSEIAAAASAAAAAASYDSFDDRYLGAKSSAPTLDNDGNALVTGALYYNTGSVTPADKGMYVYDGSLWVAASAASTAILVVYKYTATSGQTTFSGNDDNAVALAYTAGSILVTVNGALLESVADYTATNGTSVVLTSSSTVGDEVNIYAFSTFDIANVYTQTQADARYVNVTGDTMTGALLLPDGSASAPALSNDGDTNTGIFFPAADTIAFAEGGAEVARFDSSGNLGIGTSSPAAKLNVSRTDSTLIGLFSGTTKGARIGANSTYSFIEGVDTTGSASYQPFMIGGADVRFTTSDVERMRIDSSGNVGIGTSSPTEKLTVNGGAIVKGAYSGATNGGAINLSYASNAGIIYSLDPGVAWKSLDIGASLLTFGTGGTERMRIDSSGNLLVGATTNDPGTRVYSSTAGTGAWGFFARCGNGAGAIGTTNTSGTSAYNAVVFYNNGISFSLCGSISVSGTTTAYNTTSDYRLKENVVPMTGALAKISALKPVTYKWKFDGSDGQGFIAHELQEVAPDCVTGEKDALDKDGKPLYQGIDTSFLVATLTAAIQEQQALIQSQADTITAMEARLTALEVSSANASGTSVTQENK
jgi:hypothetical protein